MNRLNQVFDLIKYLNLPNIRLNQLSSNSISYALLLLPLEGKFTSTYPVCEGGNEYVSYGVCTSKRVVQEYLLHFIILILICTGLTHLVLDLYSIT